MLGRRLTGPAWQRPLATGLLLIAILGSTSACNGNGGGSRKLSGKAVAVTSVAPIGSILKNVAGAEATVKTLVPEGTDSHTFEPPPSSARDLADASLVLVNGLDLEEPMIELAQSTTLPGTPIVGLAEQTITPDAYIYDFSFPREAGTPNPHLWLDVAYAKRYAEIGRDEMSAADPGNQRAYRENCTRYAAALDRLDRAISETISTIPTKNRKLLTYHDSFAYFARRYNMTVIGAVQPSNFREPRPQEVAALVDQIRTEGIPAIFGSEVFPSDVIDQIGRESGVRYVETLRDDDLPGPPGTPDHTYMGMMIENVRTMALTLGGDSKPLEGVSPNDTA